MSLTERIAALEAELSREVRANYALTEALRDLPEMLPGSVLMDLSHIGKWPEDWDKGKSLQRQFGLEVISPKTEC